MEVEWDELIEKAYQLQDELHKDSAYLNLKLAEKEMNENEELAQLFSAYQKAQEQYIENNSEERQKSLFLIKYQIDTHPYVLAYKEKLKIYNAILLEIKKIIFCGLLKDDWINTLRVSTDTLK